MGIEELLAAAAREREAGSDAQEGQEYSGLQLPPIRSGSTAPSNLPPQLQRFALSPDQAAAQQRQGSSNSSLDEADLYGSATGSKLSTLAALSTMDQWPPNNMYNPRPRDVSGRSFESMQSPPNGMMLPSLPSPQFQTPQPAASWQGYPAPIAMRSPPGWPAPMQPQVPSYTGNVSAYSLPGPSPYASYSPSSAGPSSAPPKTYDVAESIRESVEQLRRRQQAMLQGSEDPEGFNRFAPRSQRACVNCQKAKKRCMASLNGPRPCERCVRLRLQMTCSDAPRKSDFDSQSYAPGQQQQQPPPPSNGHNNGAPRGLYSMDNPPWQQP